MDWFVKVQKTLPQKLITLSAGALASHRWPPLRNLLIRQFINAYQVDMTEAAIEDIHQFSHFNDFFTRELKPGSRPICKESNRIVSPADGMVSEFGDIKAGQLLQAKGKHYSLESLLASKELGDCFTDGSFATIYLSPRDYHRVHMPILGTAIKATYIPGKLFSVNQRTAENLDGLFAVNERLVIRFENENTPFIVILVGAMIVGGMSTVLTGKIKRSKEIKEFELKGEQLSKGQELGRFYLGSTAIVIFPENLNVKFNENLSRGAPIKICLLYTSDAADD